MASFISYLSMADGVIVVAHNDSGRGRHLLDLWHRTRFFVHDLRNELRAYRRPFRLIRSVRAAAVRARTFDMKLRQAHASSSTPTHSVGNPGERGGSPASGETSTLCVMPQSGQRNDDNSDVSD